jgi:hypothetical protein
MTELASPGVQRAPRAARGTGLRAAIAAGFALVWILLPFACTSPDRAFGPDTTATGTGAGGQGSGGQGGSTTGTATGSGGGAMVGQACSGPSGCTSGHCIDGVCCESACEGTCQACAASLTGKMDGACADVTAGTDPHSSCNDEGAATCGKSGACDGKGACAFYPAMTECAPTSCANGTKTLAKACDGSGACKDSGTVMCAMGCDGNVCKGDCTGDGSCAMGQYCDFGTGACTPKKGNGNVCQGGKPNQCASGYCADGVCCDSACTGPCVACAAALSGGADGMCSPAKSGSDPDGDCADLGPASCGTDGACNGAGACRKYASGTSCGASSCSNGTQKSGGICDGNGACGPGGTTPCAPYICGQKACKTSCASDNDCVGGTTCLNNLCGQKKGNGTACGAGSECASGNCADGVCCDAGCGGLCQACTAAKKGGGADGSCGNVVAGADPDSECTDQGAMSCADDGSCDGSGACRKYAPGTVCIQPSCANGAQSSAATCSGGMCGGSVSTPCSPYICGPTACKTSCAGDGDCSAGHFCQNTVCVAPQPQGSACTAGNQCSTGFCADGYCCDTACSGVCKSCDGTWTISGLNGTCSNIDCADPQNECAGTAICLSGACHSLAMCP